MLTPDQREQLRHVLLEALVVRAPAAYPLRALRRAIAHDVPFPCGDADLEAALQFRVDAGHLAVRYDDAGSTRYWRATAEGVLAHERGA
jgi:hypothetical protein